MIRGPTLGVALAIALGIGCSGSTPGPDPRTDGGAADGGSDGGPIILAPGQLGLGIVQSGSVTSADDYWIDLPADGAYAIFYPPSGSYAFSSTVYSDAQRTQSIGSCSATWYS